MTTGDVSGCLFKMEKRRPYYTILCDPFLQIHKVWRTARHAAKRFSILAVILQFAREKIFPLSRNILYIYFLLGYHIFLSFARKSVNILKIPFWLKEVPT